MRAWLNVNGFFVNHLGSKKFKTQFNLWTYDVLFKKIIVFTLSIDNSSANIPFFARKFTEKFILFTTFFVTVKILNIKMIFSSYCPIRRGCALELLSVDNEIMCVFFLFIFLFGWIGMTVSPVSSYLSLSHGLSTYHFCLCAVHCSVPLFSNLLHWKCVLFAYQRM